MLGGYMDPGNWAIDIEADSTIAGEVLMEGSLDLKIPCWQRRPMGASASGPVLRAAGWALFAVITAANPWLRMQML